MVLLIAIGACCLTLLAAVFHVWRGPTSADRVVATDLLTLSVVALIALVGVRLGRAGTFDLVLVATLVAFLSAVSLGRGLARGGR